MIPEWKWENIAIDFVSGFSRTGKGFDSVWVVVDRLAKFAHFLAIKTSMSLERLAKLYIEQIVRHDGETVTIVSNRGSRFMAYFWRSLNNSLGTKLTFSIAFYSQIDGQSKRVIHILEDMLWACMHNFGGFWD